MAARKPNPFDCSFSSCNCSVRNHWISPLGRCWTEQLTQTDVVKTTICTYVTAKCWRGFSTRRWFVASSRHEYCKWTQVCTLLSKICHWISNVFQPNMNDLTACVSVYDPVPEWNWKQEARVISHENIYFRRGVLVDLWSQLHRL